MLRLISIITIITPILLISPAMSAARKGASTDEKCSAIHNYFRAECGWRGISKRLCLSRGCCYNTTVAKSIWCYRKDMTHRVSDITTTLPTDKQYLKSCAVSTKKRENCGWRGINRQVCEMRGCCYDNSQRNSYWCYESDHLFVDTLTSKVLQCTSTCAHMKWSKVSDAALPCKLNESCWAEYSSKRVVGCLKSCKIQESIMEFISNVSTCLHIDEADTEETHTECDFQMSCWVERHGHTAMECFKRFSKFLHGISFEDMSFEEIEKDIGPPPGQLLRPESEMQRHNILYNEILNNQPHFEETNMDLEISIESIESLIHREG